MDFLNGQQCLFDCPAFKIAKISLLKMFVPLPKWAVPPSKFPNYFCLHCSRPCPGGLSRPQTYQSIVMYSVGATVQVGCPALEVTKVSLFIMLAPESKSGSPPRGYQSIAIYCDRASVQVGRPALEHTKVLLCTMVAPPLPKWAVPPSSYLAAGYNVRAVGCPALKITKLLPFTLCATLPR